jgi:hypothetical protein
MYLAPELLRGAGAAVPATDQWALGLMCFRALAGVEYFGHVRGFSDLVLTIAHDPLVAPSQRTVGLPGGFDAWFLRSCARRPEERFPNVPAQVAALEQALGRPAPRPIALRGDAAADRATDATANAPATFPPAAAVAASGRGSASRRKLYLAGTVVWAACALAALGWLARREQTPAHATLTPSAQPSTPPTITPTNTPTPTPTNTNTDTPTPTPTNTPSHAPTPPHHHRPALKTSALLPKGAVCRRSAECASGLCAAETCL